MNLNKAMIIGNLVRDPEMKTTGSGQNVVSFSVATNLVWTDANGQKQEKPEYHNVVAWRRLAEIINQYLKKGSKVYIEGRIQTRSWDDPNGVKRYKTEIIADNMIMLDRASSNDFTPSEPTPKPENQDIPDNSQKQETNTNNEEEISIEDIPF